MTETVEASLKSGASFFFKNLFWNSGYNFRNDSEPHHPANSTDSPLYFDGLALPFHIQMDRTFSGDRIGAGLCQHLMGMHHCWARQSMWYRKAHSFGFCIDDASLYAHGLCGS